MASRFERELAAQSTPFTRECRRLMDARLAAATTTERDDAEWAMTYLFQMHRTGRLEEYFAQLAEQQAESGQ